MKKKISILVICVMMVTMFLSGCTQKKSDTTSKDEETGSKPIEITAITSDSISNTNWGDNEISQLITEKTNVSLDIEYVLDSWSERLGLLLAGDELPDVILNCDNDRLETLLAADKVVDLTPYLEAGGENIHKIFTESDLNAMRYNTGNGETALYGLNTGYGGVDSNADWYVQVQYRLLEYFDYPVITTLDELDYYLAKYIEENPTNEAGLNNIGIMLPLKDNAAVQNVGNTALRVAGYQNDGYFFVDPTTLESQFTMTTEFAKGFVKWLNVWNESRILHSDSFSFDYTAVRTQCAQGNVLCTFMPDWQLAEAEQALFVADMSDCRYAKLPIYLDGVDPAASTVTNFDSRGNWRAIITKDCENVQAAFDLFDYMWSEEGQILCKWGVEGTNYTVDGNGVRTMKQEYIDQYLNDNDFKVNTGIGLYSYFTLGSGRLDSTGQYIDPFTTPEMTALSYKDKDKEVISIYAEKMGKSEARTWKELWEVGKQSPWGYTWKLTIPSGSTTEEKKFNRATKNVYSTLCTGGKAAAYMAQIIKANPEEFDAKWDEWIEYAYSDIIDKEAPNGIGDREDQYSTEVKNCLEEWYPVDFAEWLNNPFNWFTKPLS